MLVFKKVVAAIFMILSIIAVVVLIISLFGSWVVRGRLETITVELLLAGENVLLHRLLHLNPVATTQQVGPTT